MNDVIIIRYGELSTKGRNRYLFIHQLEKNLRFKLKVFLKLKIFSNKKRLVIYFQEYQNDQEVIDKIIKVVEHTFGIASFSVAKQILTTDIFIIKDRILELISDFNFNSFKVDILNKDKSVALGSLAIMTTIAEAIKNFKTGIIVNLTNPELTIYLEVETDCFYVMFNKTLGLKGYPVGVGGQVLVLLSGGIDSPVSSYLLMKRGLDITFLHFMTPPFTKPEAVAKVVALVKQLAKYAGANGVKLYLCNFSLLQQEISHVPLQSYRIIIMRRMFVRIANLLAKKLGIKILATGDSLGQVASQTIESLTVVNEVSPLVILRPLITYDKNEIIMIAKTIDTYAISIIPFFDCCSLFVPKEPIIKPLTTVAQKQEATLLWSDLVTVTMDKYLIEQEI